MFTSLHIANNLLYRAFDEDIKMTSMKLQKLLYFVYREYLVLTGRPLFAERFKAWQYGPVLDTIYNYFKKYRSRGIKEYYRDSENKVFAANEDCDDHLREALNRVWEEFKYYNGIELSKMTHREGTAWYEAVRHGKEYLSDKDIKKEGAFV